MTRRITAIDLDDALARIASALAALTPQERATLAADMPADIMALVDQTDAAQSQGVGLFLAAGDRGRSVPRDQISEWVRFGALDTVIQWIGGRARTCMHSPHWRRPEPVFSCAWKPGLVVCVQCLHLLGVTGAADRTCDACGHLCEGVDVGDAVYGGTLFIGALAYEFGTCGDCRPALPLGGVA